MHPLIEFLLAPVADDSTFCFLFTLKKPVYAISKDSLYSTKVLLGIVILQLLQFVLILSIK